MSRDFVSGLHGYDCEVKILQYYDVGVDQSLGLQAVEFRYEFTGAWNWGFGD